jgi:formate/nitrite transporter FocA (FNT family)
MTNHIHFQLGKANRRINFNVAALSWRHQSISLGNLVGASNQPSLLQFQQFQLSNTSQINKAHVR